MTPNQPVPGYYDPTVHRYSMLQWLIRKERLPLDTGRHILTIARRLIRSYRVKMVKVDTYHRRSVHEPPHNSPAGNQPPSHISPLVTLNGVRVDVASLLPAEVVMEVP